MFFSFGDQYLKCNNMTKMPFKGFQFDNVQCFSFKMNTVNDADLSCIYLSGTAEGDSYSNNRKSIEMVIFKSNSFSDSPQILFGAQCEFEFAATKSVLLTAGVVFGQEGSLPIQTVTIFTDNCAFNEEKAGMIVTNSDHTNVVGIDTNNFIKIPHFTYGEYCKGQNIEADVSIKACNVENCEPEACGRTIGFPVDVVPYTSVFHIDIQAPTSTPSNYFTESSKFSNSFDFTKSNEFLKTREFSMSNDFSPSKIKNIALNPTEEVKGGDDDDNSKGNGGNKDNKGKTIGIAVGVVASVAIIAAVVAIVLIKRKQKLNMSMSDGDVISQDTNAVTVDNTLQKEMDKDDPFDADFRTDNL